MPSTKACLAASATGLSVPTWSSVSPSESANRPSLWPRKTAVASEPKSASPRAVPSSKLVSETPDAAPDCSGGAEPTTTSDTSANWMP